MGKKNQKKRNSVKSPGGSQPREEKMQEQIETQLENQVDKKIDQIKEAPKELEQSQKSTIVVSARAAQQEEKKEKVDDIAGATADFADMLGDDSDEPLKVKQKKVESTKEVSKIDVPKKEEQKKEVNTKSEKVEDIADAMADFAGMLGDDSDEKDRKIQPKKTEPKKESKSLAESEFEKIDVSQSESTPKKESVVVKDNHIQESNGSSPKKRPNLVGIQSFTQGTAEEVESPMRKKKKALGQLNMKKEVCEQPKKFENLEKKFAQVFINFVTLKKEFERLKNINKADLLELRNNNKLQNISQEWQKSLEMQLPEGDPGYQEDLVEFNQLKNKEIKEMELFIQIFNEWVEESLQEFENEPFPKKLSPTIKKQSNKILQNANIISQSSLQAQSQAQELADQQKMKQFEMKKKQEEEENANLMSQLDSLAEDEDLMTGLKELEIQEKKDIQFKKNVPQVSPKAQQDSQSVKDGMVQGQGSTVDPVLVKEEQDPNNGNNSNYGLIGVVAALVIAGGVIAYRASIKK